MLSTKKRVRPCWVEKAGGGPCNRETCVVSLPSGPPILGETLPKHLDLCLFHRKELNETGICRFFENHRGHSAGWAGSEVLPPDDLPPDRHLTFLDPGVLEGVSNARGQVDSGYMSAGVSGYGDLREMPVNLEELSLTDRQLTAVCLVFYGGVKKKRAARAMNISAQALSDHVKAALNKIRTALCES